MRVLSDFPCGDITIRYLRDEAGRVGLLMFPAACAAKIAAKRLTLCGEPEMDVHGWELAAGALDPLVHVKFTGDAYSGAFAQGRTMRGSPSNARFTFREQRRHVAPGETTITTVLASKDGLRLEHLLSWHVGDQSVRIATRLVNGSAVPVTMEMLTSFSLGGMTPFHHADAPGQLKVHRFRSGWSAEGRLDTQSVEQLHLERSWSGSGMFSERFGQVGTMPVRGWFPFVAVEDASAGVLWGAQLAWAGSWQMEISRQHDDVAISGGLADREFGHWMKTLAPGEELLTPAATVACVQGALDDLCDRLTQTQQRAVDGGPKIEQYLPIVFNEWGTTWGNPSHARVAEIARQLKGSGIRYLVIDAGWYKPDVQANWDNTHGDWVANKVLFPGGLKATADAIRSCGLVPGIWFEIETCGEHSAAFSRTVHLLHRDGVPMTVRGRRFWNMNDPKVVRYLSQHVIDVLERCEFGYLKIDYNETLGMGCDEEGGGAQGEGLRRQVEGMYRFLDKIRSRLPELVIENCASGGHRHEPSMLARTAMSSFSDAHELREIPIIAANLQRLMLPRQCLVWAVLHADDTEQRLVYSLAATFLGRMCLSEEIDRLSAGQRAVVERAIGLYRKAVPIIKQGVSRRFGEVGESWRHPEGWQAVVRTHENEALVVAHGFAGAPARATLRLLAGAWKIVEQLHAGEVKASVAAGKLVVPFEQAFSGCVALLRR